MDNTSYRLSTVVAASICGMVVFTALALCAVFSYSYIKSLKIEFYDRVRAEGEEQSLKVHSFMNQAMARLQELGHDNSIRVTMMLGVDYPLSEKLAEYDQLPPGVDYFIQRKGDEKIFSSTSRGYNEILVRQALGNAPFRCSLCLSGGKKITSVYSIPIKSRSDVVGSAACIIDFSGLNLGKFMESLSGNRVVQFDKGNAYDLINGGRLALKTEKNISPHIFRAVLGDNTKGILYRGSLVPGLAYFVSDERLNTSLYRTFWLIMPFLLSVVLLSLIVSLVISRKLARPLHVIKDSASSIAMGLEENIEEKGSRISEINALQNSLAAMLDSLRKTKGLEQYQFFFDNVEDMVCITDIDGVFLEVNSTVVSSLGYERQQLLHKTFYDLIPAFERQTLHGILNSLFAGHSSGRFECSMVTRSGLTVYCEVRSRNIDFKGREALLSVVRDVTARKRDEDELQRYASELLEAKQVEEHNSARMAETLHKLEHAMAKAEIANRAKSEFLAQMSHEIRTPMNSILGMADMLSETILTSEQKNYVKIFRDSGKALMSLINDILDLSKIESGKLELEKTTFDIDTLVDEVAGVMSVSAWKKGLEFVCKVDPDVPNLFKGDPTRIKQILINLLGNAIKFTAEGSVILCISAGPEQQGKVRLTMVVQDTGIGISEDKKEAIFDNFVQADSSTTRKYGGSGLGLSITRNLVECMDGKITTSNIASGGAEFRADIIVWAVDSGLESIGSVRSALKGKNILVVEKNRVVGNYICRCLSSWGAVCSNHDSSVFMELKKGTMESSAELIIISESFGEKDGLNELEEIRNCLKCEDFALCVQASSPGDTCSLSELNRVLGVDACIRWPVTRGGLRKSIVEIYGSGQDVVEGEKHSPVLQPLRILVAEDSESNRMLIEFYLKDTPFRVTYAKDGQEAVDIYMSRKFDLVLMDMQMPEKDGFEATMDIRDYEGREGYPATPVVALTANTFAEDRQRCQEAGCTDYLGKPVKKITLIKTIMEYGS